MRKLLSLVIRPQEAVNLIAEISACISRWLSLRKEEFCCTSRVNNPPRSGQLEFSSRGTRRRQEHTEALLCFAVELAVLPGLGKNPENGLIGGV
jgi:hypothetical protein